MHPAHLKALTHALADDLDAATAARVVEQYAKRRKKTRRRMALINRDRKAVTAARSTARKTVAAFLDGARADIATQVIAARGAILGKADGPSAADVESILDAVDFTGWEELRAKLEPVLLAVTQDGIGVAFDQIGFDAPASIVDQVNQKAVEWAKARAADLVGMTYDDDGKLVPNPKPGMAITDTTREMLRTDVASAITEGWSVSEFEDQLSGNYAFSSDRAGRIAHFEIAQADVEGNLMAYRDSGVVSGKEWVLGSEHEDYDDCDTAAELGTVDLDSDFDGVGDPPAHPNCFLGETRVSAAGVTAHYRRWFQGKITVIRVAGKDLAATQNHPVLTNSGWRAIGTLQVGDYLFECSDPCAAVRLLDPHDHYVETPIEQIARALAMSGRVTTVRVPTASVDFHGDGVVGHEVDVVRPARALVTDADPRATQDAGNGALGVRHLASRGLTGSRDSAPEIEALLCAADGGVSSFRATAALERGQFGVLDALGIAEIAHCQTVALEDVPERRTVTSDAPGQFDGRGASHVLGVQTTNVGVEEPAASLVRVALAPQPVSALGEDPLDDFVSDPVADGDRLNRLAALIRRVEVTDVRQIDFAGHVYNLETRDHWYLAAGIVTHNCSCDVLPVLADDA